MTQGTREHTTEPILGTPILGMAILMVRTVIV